MRPYFVAKTTRHTHHAEQDPRLFDGSAIAQEADDEDKSAGGNQQVSCLLDHDRLSEILFRKQTKKTIHYSGGLRTDSNGFPPLQLAQFAHQLRNF